MISDREVTFFLALGELLADIEQPKRLIEKKLDAFRKARGLTEEYVRRGIRCLLYTSPSPRDTR